MSVEEGSTTEQPGALRRALGWLRAWATKSPKNLGTVALVLILVLSLPFGGWRPAEPDEVPAKPPGVKVVAAPFEVTVERAVYGPDLGGALFEESYNTSQHVLVLVRVRNTSDDTLTSLDLRTSISVSGIPEPAGVSDEPEESRQGWVSMFDASGPPDTLSGLGPGMDYVLGLHQRTLAPDAELDETELTVTLSGKTYRQLSVADTFGWVDPATTATVTVPLQRSEPLGWVEALAADPELDG